MIQEKTVQFVSEFQYCMNSKLSMARDTISS